MLKNLALKLSYLSVILFILIFNVKIVGILTLIEALPRVLGNRGKRVFISGEQRSNFEGNRWTKTILGDREHKKTNFRFLGNRGTSQFISGEQGNRYSPPPPPWERLFISRINYVRSWVEHEKSIYYIETRLNFLTRSFHCLNVAYLQDPQEHTITTVWVCLSVRPSVSS